MKKRCNCSFHDGVKSFCRRMWKRCCTNAYGLWLSPRKASLELLGSSFHIITLSFQKPFNTSIVAELLLHTHNRTTQQWLWANGILMKISIKKQKRRNRSNKICDYEFTQLIFQCNSKKSKWMQREEGIYIYMWIWTCLTVRGVCFLMSSRTASTLPVSLCSFFPISRKNTKMRRSQ